MSTSNSYKNLIHQVQVNANKYLSLAQQFQADANQYQSYAEQFQASGNILQAKEYQNLAYQRQSQAEQYQNLAYQRQSQANKLISLDEEIIKSLTFFNNYLEHEGTATDACRVILELMNGILSFLQEIEPYSRYWNSCK